jgi:hypothetical protein
MRRGIGIVWAGLGLLALVAVGIGAYQAGWSAGLATHLPSGTAPYPYYYGWHPFGFGFGLFGLLFFGLLLFLLIRFALVGRRWSGGWGGPGGPVGPGGVPPFVDERLRRWHSEAHAEPGTGAEPEDPLRPGSTA